MPSPYILRSSSAGHFIWVCSLHLDNTWLEQAKKVVQFMKGRAHVLCGDFNALRSQDFPPGMASQILSATSSSTVCTLVIGIT